MNVRSMRESRTSALAVLSLVSGFLGFLTLGLFGVAGLVVGIFALVRISASRGRLRGAGLAVTGMVLSMISPFVSVPAAVLMSVRMSRGVKERNVAYTATVRHAEHPEEMEKNIVVAGPNGLEIEMVYIEPGRFTMGRSTTFDSWLGAIVMEDFGADEGPPTNVTITKGFYIGKYKVTVDQYCTFLNSPDTNHPGHFIAFNKWARVLEESGHYVPKEGTRDCAANTVPWEGARAFCRWLSKQTDHRFRLPTEAEWEFTARGPEGRCFPWGNSERLRWATEYARKDKYPDLWKGPAVQNIGKRRINVTPDGVVGMASSVGEWVSDYYAERYPSYDEVDPTGPNSPVTWSPPLPYRVLRRCIYHPRITQREAGYYANDGGCYSFRVLMEVNESQSERSVNELEGPTACESPTGVVVQGFPTVKMGGF